MQTHKHPHSSTICFWKAHFEWKERTSQSYHEAQWSSANVCVFVYTLAHTKAGSALDVCMKLINHMLSNCVDVPRRVLRRGLTTRRAGGIWRPAEPGPSQQNPRTAHHNHTHQSPNGLQRGLSQEPTPEETMTLFKTDCTAQRTAKAAKIDREKFVWSNYSGLNCFKTAISTGSGYQTVSIMKTQRTQNVPLFSLLRNTKKHTFCCSYC